MSASTVAPKVTDTLAEDLLTAPARRAPVYRVDANAPRGRVDGDSFVTIGVHAKSGTPTLVHVNGSTQTGLALGVVGAAILHGVISDDAIAAVVAKRASL